MEYKVRGSTLEFDSGARVKFEIPIDSVLAYPCEDLVIVCLEPTGVDYDNIYAIDSIGRTRWRIAAHTKVWAAGSYLGVSPGPDENSIYAFHPSGMTYTLDLRTGRVLNSLLTK